MMADDGGSRPERSGSAVRATHDATAARAGPGATGWALVAHGGWAGWAAAWSAAAARAGRQLAQAAQGGREGPRGVRLSESPPPVDGDVLQARWARQSQGFK